MLKRRAWVALAGIGAAWLGAVAACGSTDDFQGGGRREDLPGADGGDLLEPVVASSPDASGDDGAASSDGAVGFDADALPDGDALADGEARSADTGVADVVVVRPVDTGAADSSNPLD